MNLIGINTDGLEESIRCILCKNKMKTEFGCDGNCVVDDSILANICDEISSRITERYRWHDLRKNPDDLPSEADNEEWFMCVLENHIYDTQYPYFQYNSNSKEFGVWNYICKDIDDYDLCFDSIDRMEFEKVIVWKRIELFDESED